MILTDKIDFNFLDPKLKNYQAHISLLNAGDMKTKIDSKTKKAFLEKQRLDSLSLISATQKHTKKILIFKDAKTFSRETEADGVLTQNKNLIPSVVVSDCMPIFLVDAISGIFGVLHSGWQGTGIVTNAIALLKEKFNSDPKNMFFILGPHIRNCCYNVKKKRTDYFKKIDKTCVKLSIKKLLQFNKWHYMLSLATINKTLLKKAGVPNQNIFDTELCTCCTKKDNEFIFGSNRRENFNGKGTFTHMLAYITVKT